MKDFGTYHASPSLSRMLRGMAAGDVNGYFADSAQKKSVAWKTGDKSFISLRQRMGK